jgi:alanine racemase
MERRSSRPRIADVAREAGVSKTAVSFAFNSPERLSAETATRIREVADALGYRPNPVARMLTQRRTMTLGVLTPQALAVIFSNPFFALLSEGVAQAAEELGYELHFISPLHGSLALAVGRSTVDGVVAIGLSADHPEVGQIRGAGLPMVLVDSDDLPEHGSVVVDDEGGARAAAEHVAALGHRDVLVIAVEGPVAAVGSGPRRGVTERRLRGYRAGLDAAGVGLSDDRVIAGRSSIDGGASTFLRAWASGARPTAGPRAGPARPGRPERRRLRRHRPRRPGGPAVDHRAPADPAEGRRGGPAPAGRDGAGGRASPGAPPARDPARRPRLHGGGGAAAADVTRPG